MSVALDVLLLAAGAPQLVAAGAAFAAGTINGYTWNHRWTFAARDCLSARGWYIVVQSGGLAATLALVAGIHHLTACPGVVTYLTAAVPVTAATFLANRSWTFRRRVPEPPNVRVARPD